MIFNVSIKMLKKTKDNSYHYLIICQGKYLIRNALKISSSFLKESILFILNLDYAEEDE